MKATTQTREVMVPATEEVVVLEMSKAEAQELRDILGARSIADSRGPGKDDPLQKVYHALKGSTYSGGCMGYPMWRVYDAD